jgi:hypothetical protein
VLKEGEREFLGPPEILNSTRELQPGRYVIDVNRTRRNVTVEAGKKTVLLTGDLVVESQRKDIIWVPKQGEETRLASNPPVTNTGVALFPGSYTVYINRGEAAIDLPRLAEAEVKAGKTTVVQE